MSTCWEYADCILTVNPYSTHGPLIHKKAIEKVNAHVNDAVERGAQILVGGHAIDGPGSFYAPTVLADVPVGALINTEETFGPVAPLIKFDTEEEVIKLANDTDVGLAGYFYSRDVGRVWRVAEAVSFSLVSTLSAALTYIHLLSLKWVWSARILGSFPKPSFHSVA